MKTEEIFECETCDKKFTTKFSLNRHQLVHNNVKRFTCRFCPKKFALKQYLKEHECIHTNSRPYVCGVNGCSQRFRQRGKLSLHRRKHKGYKMKQYHLICRDNDLSHDITETDSLMDASHQEMSAFEHPENQNEHSEKSTFAPKPNATRKRKATKDNSESDSDFEIPLQVGKNKARPSRTVRKRKATKQFEDESEDSFEPSDHQEFDRHSESKMQDFTRIHHAPTAHHKPRKESNDSTLEGSIHGKFQKKKEASKRHPKSAFSVINPNFEYLVNASKIHNRLNQELDTQQELSHRNEEQKISSGNQPTSLYSINDGLAVLNKLTSALPSLKSMIEQDPNLLLTHLALELSKAPLASPAKF
jgi:hypothetical protein